jgi:hypothetical protein
MPLRSRRGSSTRSRLLSKGQAVWQRRGRTDPVGLPGAIYVAVAKSDSAALGIHGIAVRRAGAAWETRTFLEPQGPTARRHAMELIGAAIARILEITGLDQTFTILPTRDAAAVSRL